VEKKRRKRKTGFSFKVSDGGYDLEAQAQVIGSDLLVAIWGGTAPHIGAVSLAQPRPSLKDPERTSATASVICVVGHKEDELVKKASEFMAACLNVRVVVTAGIHWDHMSEEDIQTVVRNAERLVRLITEEIRTTMTPTPGGHNKA